MLSIALPKGRLGNKVYRLFSDIGYPCQAMETDDRRLIIPDEANDIRYLLVKPSDVAIYVEHGAADIGVVGKDVLLEGNNLLYELLDLQFGKCNIAEAAPVGYVENKEKTLRVATKYPNVAKAFYASQSRLIEIIKLNGSIELAPLLGLSDVIVDIVETGTTLKHNNLMVTQTICPISARLIANQATMRFKGDRINHIVQQLQNAIKSKEMPS